MDLIKKDNKIVQEFKKVEILDLKETHMKENKEDLDTIQNKNPIKEISIAKEEAKVIGDSQTRDRTLKITIKTETNTKTGRKSMKKEEKNMRTSIMISET